MTDPSSSDYETFQKKASEVFSYLDINKDGTLSYDELKRGFHKLRLPIATHEDLYKAFDMNPTKNITKEQFDKYVEAQYLKVKELFDKLDIQRDYKLTQQELTVGLQLFDPSYHFTDESIKKVFSVIDKNKDGSISFDEWCEFLILMPKLNIKEVINYWETVIAIVDPNEFALYGIQGTKPPVAEATGKYSGVKKWFISLGSGLFAGVVSRTSTAPLERLKLIYQIRYKGTAQPPSIFTGLKDIVKQDGIKGLFRGNLITCLRAGPETSIKLAAFDKQTSALTQYRGGGPLASGDLFLAGAASGVIASTVTHPMGVIKTRFAAAPSGTYSGILDVIKKTASAEGNVRPFFKGLQPTIMAVVPLSGLNLMSYEMLKSVLIGKKPTKEPSTLTFMMIGGLSAFMSSTLLYPTQIVTSRMIMQGVSGEQQQKGMIGIAKDVLKHEGSKGFFKGFTAAMSKIIIGNSISYGCFEFLKKNGGYKG